MLLTDQTRPTRAEISLSNLANNLAIVKSQIQSDVKIMAMVKANAYGHGIERIAKELVSLGVDALGVAYLEEAAFLRESGVKAPIVVLGAVNSWQIHSFLSYDVELCTSSIAKAQAISQAAKEKGCIAKIHLKIDTGMERIGVQWHNAPGFIDEVLKLSNLQIKGVFSHFAKAENDRDFTLTQLDRFQSVLKEVEKRGVKPEFIHLANSAAILNYKESHFNMVRPGIMLYGYNPNGYLPETCFGGRFLLPVMTFKTKVSYFKVVQASTGISYNHTFVTPQTTRMITLPVGYGDGYSRLLSNKADVILRGQRYPVAGNICMDQTMVDIGPQGTAYNGDDVLLFGQMDGMVLPLEELCQKIGTIPYEVLCLISLRVPRIYIIPKESLHAAEASM
ncbi:MAG: alanine racemase [Candidatus Brocadiae bacterium]|nr:alanine racemase [Candidatus Brocadiia bacterium]